MIRYLSTCLAWISLVLAITTHGSETHDARELVPMDRSALRQALVESEGRTVLLNLWATWCTPCLREIPDLLSLEEELRESDVRLLAISMDDAFNAAWVTDFKNKHFPSLVSFINAEVDMDALVSAVDPIWNETLPTTYIINRDGAVVQKIQGKKPAAFFREQLIAAGL